ncbi:MAG TPA: MBL fold metallo-hydrolase [Candidatus Saccharimonadales bacterium]|nr:MBL fold metallo-hydrolase [Candidatus Saccharimonadales bacterium]
MKIKFLGASSGIVTGSCYVLTSASGRSILIDLGMFQGIPDIEKLNYEPFNYDCKRIIGAVLTHAHLDHCGRLPILLPLGFNGDIWMTQATRDLTELSLFDTAKIARNDGKPILFDKKLVEKTVTRFRSVNYHVPFQIGDFTISMYDAGHILGSASLEIEDKNPNSEIRKIVFSGDLGNSPEPLEKETEIFNDANAVVMESTYGDRIHPKENPIEALQSEVNKIEVSGGTLLIPAFSLERTQELLHMIMHLKKANKVLAQTPFYLDSPMAEKATIIYTNYPKYFNSHIQDDLRYGSPFDFPNLNIIEDERQSEGVHTQSGPKVIIAGSGMMTGGRIVNHATYYLPIASTRLFIVGYQGEQTLGRELLEGNKKVIIDGLEMEVKATVNDTQSLSSHADQHQLINWLTEIKNVKKIFITHGDDISRQALAGKITENLGIKNITLPLLSQDAELL